MRSMYCGLLAEAALSKQRQLESTSAAGVTGDAVEPVVPAVDDARSLLVFS